MTIRFFTKADAPNILSHKATIEISKLNKAGGAFPADDAERKEQMNMIARRIAYAICDEMGYDFFQMSNEFQKPQKDG